jgi:amino acid transporter
MRPTRDTRQLTWFLAWAVVFCDIGTSVYYVPGILYGHVKDATPFFVLLTTGGFILLALKYIEISWRNPEGGGVVTITTKAFGPMGGCLSGMLITWIISLPRRSPRFPDFNISAAPFLLWIIISFL